MFQILSDFPDDVLAVSATGKVTAEDYDQILVPAVEARMRQHKPLKLFFHFGPQYEGMETGAKVEDARLGIAHWRDWGRIAVVTDSGLLRDAIGFFALMFRHPFQLFFNADYRKAKAWIEERQSEEAA
jgi:hypothetical protein